MDASTSYGGSTSSTKPKTKSKDREPKDLVEACRKRLQASYEHDQKNREEAAEDLRFLAGDQWPDKIKRERTKSGRPMLTINQLPQFVHQVTNDIRQADFSIKVAPVDEGSDKELAKIFDGLIRQIQYQSAAPEVYAGAGEHQVACGIGNWRICSEYVGDEQFEQELRIKLIPNPLSVYYDPGAVEPDKSDANFVIITEIIPKEDFKARYPKAAVSDVDSPGGTGDTMQWVTPEGVRIAEYWCRHEIERELVQQADGGVRWLDEAIAGIQILKKRSVTTYEVVQYIVSGTEVLEDPVTFPGKYIPIVPVLGDEIPQESGAVVRKGMVRDARDPQRLYNYNRSASAESLALQPKNPWVVTMDMIKNYIGHWAGANTSNRPFLPYDPDPKAQGAKPYREAPAALSPAFANEAMLAREDLSGTTGIYPAALGAQSNETSGVAIGRREKQGDTANFHYSAKLQRALWHTGRILLEAIPAFYDTERVIRTLGEDDSEELVKVNQQAVDEFGAPILMDGKPMIMNDLSSANFDVRVKIGPSFSSKREEAAAFITEFLRVDPSAAPIVRDQLAKYSDMAGADEMAKRFKNVLEGKPPLADPEAPPEPPPPPPEMLKMQADQQLAEQKLAQEDARAQQQMQIEVQKIQIQAQLEMEKMRGQLELERERMMAELAMQRERMGFEMQIKESQAAHSAALAEKNAEAKAKVNGNGADKPN
jgi:hypothetical protein